MSIELPHASSMENFDTLVCIDGSYVIYHTLFSAVKKWTDESPYSDCLNDIDTSDENFVQEDITRYPDFVDSLKSSMFNTLNRIQKIVSDYNSVYFKNTYGKMLFVLDPVHGAKSKSWRYGIYPEYKGQRREQRERKPYDVYRVFEKLLSMLTDDENAFFEKKFNLRFITVDNAEADDIIATIFLDERNKEHGKLLIASDTDYLQLEDVTQMNIEGKQILIEQPYPELIEMTPSLYLLAKIIAGDKSDNITQVFNRVAYKTAVKKYVANTDYLTECLEHDAVANERFSRNAKLIDFSRIPKKIKAMVLRTMAECGL